MCGLFCWFVAGMGFGRFGGLGGFGLCSRVVVGLWFVIGLSLHLGWVLFVGLFWCLVVWCGFGVMVWVCGCLLGFCV